MAQHDYIISNQSGAAFRADLNNGLAAIVSQNSGAAQPSSTYAYQWWADTTTGLLKIRNAANSTWITIGTLASANLGLIPAGSGSIVNADVNASAGIVASKLAFTQAGTGATARTIDSKLKDVVSVKDFGAIGNGVADDTAAIQAAVNSGARTVYFPNGSYKVNSTIRQATNGYAMRLVGENKHHAVLVAGPSLTAGAPIVWFGNSSGHGNYRAQVSYLTFLGNNSCVGLRYHEAGTSEIVSCQFVDCTIGISCPGVIGSQIQRCEIYNCTVGINMTRPIQGTPSGPDDITITASPLALSNNVNKVSDCWISGGSCGVHVEGGLTHIQGCTFQAVGNNAARSVIELVTANESTEYGGGPIVSNCWSESGTYLAFVYLESTRKAVIRENFISLDGVAQEGIYADSGSIGTTVQNNSFLGRGTAALTGSRTQNAAVYIDSVQTTLMNNHYASFGTYTYAQLIKLNWATTSGNVVIEQGQNAGNGYGIYLGLTQVGIGGTGLIGPNPLVGAAFNNFLNGHQLSGCSHDSIYFNTGAGPLFFVKAGAPVAGDATFVGDLCLDRTNANLYLHAGAGAWKLITRAA